MQKKKSRRKEKICVGVIGYAIFLIDSEWIKSFCVKIGDAALFN